MIVFLLLYIAVVNTACLLVLWRMWKEAFLIGFDDFHEGVEHMTAHLASRAHDN